MRPGAVITLAGADGTVPATLRLPAPIATVEHADLRSLANELKSLLSPASATIRAGVCAFSLRFIARSDDATRPAALVAIADAPLRGVAEALTIASRERTITEFTLVAMNAAVERPMRSEARRTLVWFGDAHVSRARSIAPPPTSIPDLLQELISFTHRKDLDAMSRAILSYLQLLAIHPYCNGNGRTARCMLASDLIRHGADEARAYLLAAILGLRQSAAMAAGEALATGQPERLSEWIHDAMSIASQWLQEIERIGEERLEAISLLRSASSTTRRIARAAIGRAFVAHTAPDLIPGSPVREVNRAMAALSDIGLFDRTPDATEKWVTTHAAPWEDFLARVRAPEGDEETGASPLATRSSAAPTDRARSSA